MRDLVGLLVGFCYAWFRLEVEGRERVPRTGAFILAPVHRSNLDTPIVASVTRRPLRWQQQVFTGFGAALFALVAVILVSAFQRLLLYEAAYGFTRIRTGVHVFMVWLGILLLVTALLVVGIRESARTNALIVAVKVFVVGFVIVAGLGWLFDTMDQQLFNLARKPAVEQLLGRLAAFHPRVKRAERVDREWTFPAGAVIDPGSHEEPAGDPYLRGASRGLHLLVVIDRGLCRDQSVGPAVPEQQLPAAGDERGGSLPPVAARRGFAVRKDRRCLPAHPLAGRWASPGPAGSARHRLFH